MAKRSAPRMILGLRPQDTLPDWINRMIVLGNKGEIICQDTRFQVERTLRAFRDIRRGLRREDFPYGTRTAYDSAKRLIRQGSVDDQVMRDLNLVDPRSGHEVSEARRDGEPIIEMDGVKVQYGDKVVLGDWEQQASTGERMPGLHWTIRRGQRWVIIGSNGSGKTTLLSLITSDHPQTYAVPVRLFGRSRLPEKGRPAISLFELQSRLGHSSPEIHAFFPRQLTLRQSVESAFAATFLSKPKLNHERDLDVERLLQYFKPELSPHGANEPSKSEMPAVVLRNPRQFPIGTGGRKDFAGKLNRMKGYTPPDYAVEYADTVAFGDLSTAQQRLVLFLRALVHRPDIVSHPRRGAFGHDTFHEGQVYQIPRAWRESILP